MKCERRYEGNEKTKEKMEERVEVKGIESC